MAANEINGNRRHRWIMTPLAFGCLILMGAGVKLIHASDQVTEEIRREYKLSPGASVEVSNINGPVEIETADTDKAEVHIVRSARTQKDFSDRQMIIEQTSAGLVVRGDPPLDWLRSG